MAETYEPAHSRDDSDYEDDPYYEGERYCWSCGGRGWRVTCLDDLCHGKDECIHGDPPTPCRECNPKGDRFDDY